MAEYQIRVTPTGIQKRLAKKLRDKRFVNGPLRKFLGVVGAVLERGWKERVSVDTGRYRSSINHKVDPFGQKVVVGTNVSYAVHREFGSKPHFPPLAALQPWARRHGFGEGAAGAFLVARAIARRGTKPENAIKRTVAATRGTINRAVQNLAKEVGIQWGKNS